MAHATRALALAFACIFTAHNTRCHLPWGLVIGCMHEKNEKKRQETLELLAKHLENFKPRMKPSMRAIERKKKTLQELKSLFFGAPKKPAANLTLESNQCSAETRELTTEEQEVARVQEAITLLQELDIIHADLATLLQSTLDKSTVENVDQFIIQAIQAHQSLKSRL